MAGRVNANPRKGLRVKRPTILGYNLRFLRLAMGYSLSDIELMTGRVRSNINGIETGVVKDHGNVAAELESLFGFPFGGLRHGKIEQVMVFLDAPGETPTHILCKVPADGGAWQMVRLERGGNGKPVLSRL